MKIYDYSDGDQNLITFIEENVTKSSFILSNLSIEDKVVRYMVDAKKICGMYIIVNKKFITFLFDDDVSNEQCSHLLADAKKYEHVSGTVINPLYEVFANYYVIDEENQDTWCEVANINQMDILKQKYKCDYPIKKLQYEEIDDYIAGLQAAGVFPGIVADTVQKMYVNTLTYVVWDNDQIIAGANLSLGSDRIQVITGVFTNPLYENKHIATTIVTKLLVDNQKQNGIYSIFFTNPVAKHIYLQLGFEVKDKLLIFKNS